MSQIAEDLSFAVLSITKLENSGGSCDFLEVTQGAKVALTFVAWALCPAKMLFGHIGCPKNANI